MESATRMTDGDVVARKPGNAGGAKVPCFRANARSGKSLRIDVSLATLPDSVQTLQRALQTKAKNEPATRFYSLWDKVYRWDILVEAYLRCRGNRGAPGVDGESFGDIEAAGRDRWLERLQQELKAKTYQPQPLLRVW
jgi:RNA-directed DNA polymerase